MMLNTLDESIYIKAKELREMVRQLSCTSFVEDKSLLDKLFKTSLEIPFHIGISLNLCSTESVEAHLNDASNKLIELCIAIDLCTSEYFKTDIPKMKSIVDELFKLIPIVIEKAREDERVRLEEIMSEFYVKEKEEEDKS